MKLLQQIDRLPKNTLKSMEHAIYGHKSCKKTKFNQLPSATNHQNIDVVSPFYERHKQMKGVCDCPYHRMKRQKQVPQINKQPSKIYMEVELNKYRNKIAQQIRNSINNKKNILCRPTRSTDTNQKRRDSSVVNLHLNINNCSYRQGLPRICFEDNHNPQFEKVLRRRLMELRDGELVYELLQYIKFRSVEDEQYLKGFRDYMYDHLLGVTQKMGLEKFMNADLSLEQKIEMVCGEMGCDYEVGRGFVEAIQKAMRDMGEHLYKNGLAATDDLLEYRDNKFMKMSLRQHRQRLEARNDRFWPIGHASADSGIFEAAVRNEKDRQRNKRNKQGNQGGKQASESCKQDKENNDSRFRLRDNNHQSGNPNDPNWQPGHPNDPNWQPGNPNSKQLRYADDPNYQSLNPNSQLNQIARNNQQLGLSDFDISNSGDKDDLRTYSKFGLPSKKSMRFQLSQAHLQQSDQGIYENLQRENHENSLCQELQRLNRKPSIQRNRASVLSGNRDLSNIQEYLNGMSHLKANGGSKRNRIQFAQNERFDRNDGKSRKKKNKNLRTIKSISGLKNVQKPCYCNDKQEHQQLQGIINREEEVERVKRIFQFLVNRPNSTPRTFSETLDQFKQQLKPEQIDKLSKCYEAWLFQELVKKLIVQADYCLQRIADDQSVIQNTQSGQVFSFGSRKMLSDKARKIQNSKGFEIESTSTVNRYYSSIQSVLEEEQENYLVLANQSSSVRSTKNSSKAQNKLNISQKYLDQTSPGEAVFQEIKFKYVKLNSKRPLQPHTPTNNLAIQPQSMLQYPVGSLNRQEHKRILAYALKKHPLAFKQVQESLNSEDMGSISNCKMSV